MGGWVMLILTAAYVQGRSCITVTAFWPMIGHGCEYLVHERVPAVGDEVIDHYSALSDGQRVTERDADSDIHIQEMTKAPMRARYLSSEPV